MRYNNNRSIEKQVVCVQKFHTILAWALLLLLAVHAALGCVALLTPVFLMQKGLAYLLLALLCIHMGLALWKTLRGKRPRMLFAYFWENRLYWLRVFSGIAIFVLVLIHRTLWTIHTPFGVLLRDFEWPSLLVQGLLTAALAVHICINLRPLLVDSGVEQSARARRRIGLLILLLALAALAGAVWYFVRMNVL